MEFECGFSIGIDIGSFEVALEFVGICCCVGGRSWVFGLEFECGFDHFDAWKIIYQPDDEN